MGYVNIILIIYLCLLKGPNDAKHFVYLVSCNVLTWFKVKKTVKNFNIILRTLYIIVAPPSWNVLLWQFLSNKHLTE